jgi:perosamine synthetase
MATHLEPAYSERAGMALPVTERMTAQTLILPLYHTLTDVEQDQVVAVLTDAAKGKGAA